jgi:hypothetical protein
MWDKNFGCYFSTKAVGTGSAGEVKAQTCAKAMFRQSIGRLIKSLIYSL